MKQKPQKTAVMPKIPVRARATGLLGSSSVRSNPRAAPPGSGKKCTRTEEGVHPATTLLRSPDGKSQRGYDEGKGIGNSGHDEETEDGGTIQETKWKGDRSRKMAEGYKMLHAGDGRSNGVGIIVNVEISKEVVRV